MNTTTAAPIFEGAQPQTRRLLTVKQFARKHEAFTEGALRNLIFNSLSRRSSKREIKGNGFKRALVRLGRRVLIDEQKFFAVVDEVSNQGQA